MGSYKFIILLIFIIFYILALSRKVKMAIVAAGGVALM
jgi:hypothetical protein